MATSLAPSPLFNSNLHSSQQRLPLQSLTIALPSPTRPFSTLLSARKESRRPVVASVLEVGGVKIAGTIEFLDFFSGDSGSWFLKIKHFMRWAPEKIPSFCLVTEDLVEDWRGTPRTMFLIGDRELDVNHPIAIYDYFDANCASNFVKLDDLFPIASVKAVGDWVFLRVSPMNGVQRFGVRGKLVPRYVGPFEIIARVGKVAYRVAIPLHLSAIHDVFHISNLRKYMHDPQQVIGYENLDMEFDLAHDERPMQILDSVVKKIHNKEIHLVKVIRHRHGVEDETWENEADL